MQNTRSASVTISYDLDAGKFTDEMTRGYDLSPAEFSHSLAKIADELTRLAATLKRQHPDPRASNA